MLKQTLLLSLAATLCAGGAAAAQDVMRVAPNHYRVLVDNEHVRVIENTLAPGEADSTHSHPSGWYYVTRPGKMRVEFADGKTETWEPAAGESAWMAAEGPHISRNIGATTMSFVLVEVKSAQPRAVAGRSR